MADSILREEMAGAAQAGRHVGQFYRDTKQMEAAACSYITEGLRRGEAVIAVVSRACWAAMVGRLAMKSSVDLSDAVVSGQLRYIDADLVLSAVFEAGMPDSHRFHERAGSLIERAHRRFGRVRVFTELAGMLWRQGNRGAAIRLEELWHGLGGKLPFSLSCAYLTENGDAEGYNSRLKCVCNAHSHPVPPDESRLERTGANALKQDFPPETPREAT